MADDFFEAAHAAIKILSTSGIEILVIQTLTQQGQCWDMAQTRRMARQKAELPDAPKFSPCYGSCQTTG
jgi:hypothetical protein